MKSTIIVCAIVVLACLCLHAEADVEVVGKKIPPRFRPQECGRIVHQNDTSIMMVGCGEELCPEGKQIGYKPTDNTKDYPECCGGPICAP